MTQRQSTILILVSLLAVVAGCPKGTSKTSPPPKADPEPAPPPPALLKPEVRKLATDNNVFAMSLHDALLAEKPGKNLFFSPYSISVALAMTYAGARGRTAKQMAKALHFKLPGEQLHPRFGQLQAHLNAPGNTRPYKLAVANRLWGNKGNNFDDGFVKVTKASYNATLEPLDFVGAPAASTAIINDWVAKKTMRKITDLIPLGVINAETRLVLTNAIYFKGNWDRQFKTENTAPAPFYLSDGGQVDAPLMNQTDEFAYYSPSGNGAEDTQLLGMPYVGGQLKMVVVLPSKAGGLASLKNLNKSIVGDGGWLTKMRTQEVAVTFPKFRMTTTFALKKTLSKMGMPLAFTRGADFSGMSAALRLHIDAVIHKAFVEVNEEGTEAAAATAVVMADEGARPPIPVFRADHPFLFLIIDNASGSILFVGRVVDPTSKADGD